MLRKKMIKREKYLTQIRGFYESDLIKVIVGIRRCGKSFILQQIMDEIRQKTDNIIYLNFERTSDYLKASDSTELINYVNEHRKEGKCYIFLDEIQEVKNWHLAIKDLRLDNNSIFITGSNSKLLSSEITSFLSGRYVSFKIRPFIYKEIVELSHELNFTTDTTDYLIWGGMPGRFYLNKTDQQAFLRDLEETIIFNDLIKRYRIPKVVVFKKIVYFILKSNSRIFSARTIQKYLREQCESTSLNTVLKYINYLKEAYIIDAISQYSKKAKKELAYYEKIYNADVSFNSLSVTNNRYDLDHNLENIVYNELLYMGYELKVYDNNSKEVDFYATKDGKEYFIQVAYTIVDEKTYAREFSAFVGLDPFSQKIIITNDTLDYSTSLVKHIKLQDFLLLDSLEE